MGRLLCDFRRSPGVCAARALIEEASDETLRGETCIRIGGKVVSRVGEFPPRSVSKKSIHEGLKSTSEW